MGTAAAFGAWQAASLKWHDPELHRSAFLHYDKAAFTPWRSARAVATSYLTSAFASKCQSSHWEEKSYGDGNVSTCQLAHFCDESLII